jgi:hypothetical protein
MQARRLDQDSIQIFAPRAELDILRQCLNEVCNGIAIPEFETRIGAAIDDVRAMLRTLRGAVT